MMLWFRLSHCESGIYLTFAEQMHPDNSVAAGLKQDQNVIARCMRGVSTVNVYIYTYMIWV